MKFLCDHCKAKYQIADDKVAGKTVRMKCRKCGQMIEVKSEVTETSVAKALATPTPMPAPTASQPVAPKAPARPMATSLAGAPRPSAAQKPAAPTALASSFAKSVTRDENSASRSLRELAAEEEWYVAINGVPVGPIRMSELRRKAAVGAVTEDSLAWQEGLEEWRPVRTFPELAAAVREAAAAGRSSLAPRPPAPAPPAAAPQSVRPAPSAPSRPVTSPIAPLAPATAARSNVVPFAGRGAVAERLEPEPMVVSDPFAAPAPISAPTPAPAVAAAAVPAPAESQPAESQPVLPAAPLAAASLPLVPREEPSRKSPPWIVIAMLVLAAAFGVTAALAIFLKPAQAPAPVVIVSAAPPAPQPPPPTVTATAPAPPDTVAQVEPATSATTDVRKPTGGGAVAAKPTATTSAKPVDPSIAALLGGSGAGPSVGPSGGGGGGGGGSLTSEQIESVVRSRQSSVKTKCWVRSGSQLSSVNVRVRVTVGPTGAVQNATAEGNDPVVAKCIETQVRGWQFPATGGTTTVEIPFHFLAQ
jgi:predicted Zn finger-like uncharacterized protein